MAADPPPAEFEVSRTLPDGGTQIIYACRAHLAETKRFMAEGGYVPVVGPADPAVHGCKGHLAGWPAAGD